MNPTRYERTFIDFACPLGAGALKATQGQCQIAIDFDTEFGIPGPRELDDATGIASGYRVIKILKHADTNVAITTNGTSTRVYRLESDVWVSKVDQLDGGAQNQDLTGVAVDAVSFKDVLAVALGSATAYVYTSATTTAGAQTWDFTTSTKTLVLAKRAQYFLKQHDGLITSRVLYVVNPNQIYFTDDLTNTDTTGVLPYFIGDTSATSAFFTSLLEEPGTGRVLFGMRHQLFWMHFEPAYDGIWESLTEFFDDPVLEADTGTAGAYNTGNRMNFENPAVINGVVYYPIQGRDILAWYGPGRKHSRYMAPRYIGGTSQPRRLPRLDLPINAMTAANGYLYLFMGSELTATVKDISNMPGGNSRLVNQFSNFSEMWKGIPNDDGSTITWHGVQLVCTNLLRYAWFDEDAPLMYMASKDSESANHQQKRTLVPLSRPDTWFGLNAIVLNAGTGQFEPGPIDLGDAFTNKRWELVRLNSLMAASTTIEVEFAMQTDWITTAFNSDFVTYTDEDRAFQGDRFPEGTSVSPTLNLRFKITGSSNTYAIPIQADVWSSWAQDATQLPAGR